MSDVNYMTKEGLDQLKAELKELKTTGRADAAKAIASAREQGDLSENAEYDAAKEAQGMLERKIAELETAVALARVIDESKLDASKVSLLSVVEIKNVKNNKTFKYTIVSEAEADIKAKKLSVQSPIGKGLLSKEEGEIAAIETPNGVMEFEVVSISLS